MQLSLEKVMNLQYITKLCASFLSAVIIVCPPSFAMAEIFCVQNQAELLSALNIAAKNGEDDILRIVQGSKFDDVKLPSEPGYLIKIEGGYSTDCTSGREHYQSSSNIEQSVIESASLPKPQQNTTGPVPPEGVKPAIATFSGDALSGGTDVTVLGVLAYLWRHGCGPTSVGMVVGYWDKNGCSDLYDGDASTQTSSIDQGIASQGSTSTPRHYEDYSLPEDAYPTILPDKSELPAGDEHIDNSIADFMHTSWSSDQNYYGWSWSNQIIPAFTNYAKLRNNTYNSSTSEYYYGSSLTWTVLTSEIDAKRPMVFLVDSSGDGYTDHFVTIVGYRLDGSTQYYGCLDTWSSTIRWEQFRGMSSSYSWGVSGGFSFQLTCAPSGATLSGITINGPINVNESSTATYTATASWSDGSTTTVTPSWSENSTYTMISSDGVLTTSSVTANQTATVSASYTSGGVTKTGVYLITVVDVPATLSGITINGPTNVNESSTATYTATASWSDGSTTAVTPSWSENSTYTMISADGVLTTSSVTANQTVTVSASYTSGGVTKTGVYLITVVDVPAIPALGEAVDNTSLTWETGGNANWLGQTTTVYYGGDAAQNGDIVDSQQSDIQTIVTGPGTLSFYWKVSSEKDWDYLRFSIDGTIQSGSISGIVDWTQKSFTIPAGSHILKWSYTKDGTASSNDDSGWLDKVEWTSTPTVTATLSVNTTGSGTIISSPEGVNCGTDCSNNFILNAEITLTAIPADGETFIGWLGDGCSGTEECIVVMDTNKEITAIFKNKFPWLMFLPTITKGSL